MIKTATGFSPYQLVHGVESILLVECEIPSSKLAVELLPDTSPLEEHLVHLEQLNEQCRDALVALEVKKHYFIKQNRMFEFHITKLKN